MILPTPRNKVIIYYLYKSCRDPFLWNSMRFGLGLGCQSNSYSQKVHLFRCYCLNNRFLRVRSIASTPKMEYQGFLCIFQKNSAMATLGLKEMGKFLRGSREKGLPCWQNYTETANWANFFPSLPKVIFPFPSNLKGL